MYFVLYILYLGGIHGQMWEQIHIKMSSLNVIGLEIEPLEGHSCGSRILGSLEMLLLKDRIELTFLSAGRESRPGEWVWKPGLVSWGKRDTLKGIIKANTRDLTVVPKADLQGIKTNSHRINIGKNILDFSILEQSMRSSLSQSTCNFWQAWHNTRKKAEQSNNRTQMLADTPSHINKCGCFQCALLHVDIFEYWLSTAESVPKRAKMAQQQGTVSPEPGLP